MSLDLRSVEAKFKRGTAHANCVIDEVVAWAKKDAYGAVQKVNSDFTEYRLVAKIVGEMPDFERWSLIIGDSLHNIRCTLDHLVYAIAVHESGKNPPPNARALSFPICDDCPAFTKAERKKLVGISRHVCDAIEKVQPYHRRHPTIPPPIAVLRDLENTDKHQLLGLVSTTPVAGNIHLSGPQPRKEVSVFPNYGEIKDGVEIVCHVFDSPTPNLNYDFAGMKLAVAIWHGKLDPLGEEWTGRNDFTAVLPLLIKETRFIIDTVSAAVI
jgi:hypothetical protein